jgi:hypothetical protein
MKKYSEKYPDPDTLITLSMAFDIAERFIEKHFNLLNSGNADVVLGSMHIRVKDGLPFDIAVCHDWIECWKIVKDKQ